MVGARARAGQPILGDHHVPELRSRADRAADDTSLDQQPTANAGAQRQQHCVRRAMGGAPAPLGEHRRVAVVVDEHWQSQTLRHEVADRDVFDREVIRGKRHATGAVHETRQA